MIMTSVISEVLLNDVHSYNDAHLYQRCFDDVHSYNAEHSPRAVGVHMQISEYVKNVKNVAFLTLLKLFAGGRTVV